eukprot:13743231-Alexandrium_andersonii.AAC.1
MEARARDLDDHVDDEGVPPPEQADQRALLGQGLAHAVDKHIFPPMGIGSRKASLLPKAQALLQTMWLEMG